MISSCTCFSSLVSVSMDWSLTHVNCSALGFQGLIWGSRQISFLLGLGGFKFMWLSAVAGGLGDLLYLLSYLSHSLQMPPIKLLALCNTKMFWRHPWHDLKTRKMISLSLSLLSFCFPLSLPPLFSTCIFGNSWRMTILNTTVMVYLLGENGRLYLKQVWWLTHISNLRNWVVKAGKWGAWDHSWHGYTGSLKPTWTTIYHI